MPFGHNKNDRIDKLASEDDLPTNKFTDPLLPSSSIRQTTTTHRHHQQGPSDSRERTNENMSTFQKFCSQQQDSITNINPSFNNDKKADGDVDTFNNSSHRINFINEGTFSNPIFNSAYNASMPINPYSITSFSNNALYPNSNIQTAVDSNFQPTVSSISFDMEVNENFPPAIACTPEFIEETSASETTTSPQVSHHLSEPKTSFDQQLSFVASTRAIVNDTFQKKRKSDPTHTVPTMNDMNLSSFGMRSRSCTLPPGTINVSTNDSGTKSTIQPTITKTKKYPIIKRRNASNLPKSEDSGKNKDPNVVSKAIELIVSKKLVLLCETPWNSFEINENRRIIRFLRKTLNNSLILDAFIVNLDLTNKIPQHGYDATTETSYIEVSCLRCLHKTQENTIENRFYITSVEVIKVVEFLIGTIDSDDLNFKRKERGRIRSNLVPFWSKYTIKSKSHNSPSSLNKSSREGSLELYEDSENTRFRNELGNRIMSYNLRKPRGFDKDVRILSWNKLIPALERALQSYFIQFEKTPTT